MEYLCITSGYISQLATVNSFYKILVYFYNCCINQFYRCFGYGHIICVIISNQRVPKILMLLFSCIGFRLVQSDKQIKHLLRQIPELFCIFCTFFTVVINNHIKFPNTILNILVGNLVDTHSSFQHKLAFYALLKC